MKKLLIVLLPALLFTGCALIDRLNTNDTTTQLAVQYATLKMIDQSNTITSDDVLEHVGRVKSVTSRDTGTTVARLVISAEAHIPWAKIDRADQLLIRALLQAVSDELEDRVGEGTLDPGQRVTVLALLGWIEDAAGM